jgi:gamma-glutamyltranspeptidase / glutathione hydrolase
MRNSWKACVGIFAMFMGITTAVRANGEGETSISGPFKAAVAAAHPIAVEAGMEILRLGGNAIDAAVATAFTLGVVEPSASGIGGGGFLLYRDAVTDDAVFYDYRETAPAALTPDVLAVNGRYPATRLRDGGLAVGVPGTVRGLLLAHEEHGSLPLPVLLAPAIRAARDGFAISQLHVNLLNDNLDKLAGNEAAAEVHLEDALFPRPVGSILVQKDLATTLEAIAAHGVEAIYGGEMATRIAEAVVENGGVMTAGDVMGFAVVKREPLRGDYRGYTLLTAPPPSSGGIQLLQALGVLSRIDLSAHNPDSAIHAAILVTLLNQTMTDSDNHAADPGHHEIPMDVPAV